MTQLDAPGDQSVDHQVSPNRWSSVAVLAIGTFAIGTDAFVIAGVLPALSDSLHVSVGAAGQLVTVFALGYALSAPFVGALTAHWPRHVTLLTALAVFVIGNAVTALAPSYSLILVSRIVAAVGAALYTSTASATAAGLVAPQHRGRAIAIVMLGLTSSLVLGTPIGTAISALGNWRWTLWFVTALGALAAVAIALRLPVLRAAGERPQHPVRRLAEPLRDRRIRNLLTSTFIVFLGIYTPYTYFSEVYRPSIGVGGGLAAALLVYGIAATLGNLAAGWLTDRIGADRVVITATIPLTVILAALPALRIEAWIAVPTIVISAVLSFSVTTPQQHRLLSIAPEAGSVATSLYQAVLYLAVSASAVLGAMTLEVAGATWLGPVSATFVGAAVLLTIHTRRSETAADRQ